VNLSFFPITEEDRVKYLLSHTRTERESDVSANFCSAAHTEKEISEKLPLGMQKSRSNYGKLLCT
jgi:hypothetical protein